MLHDLSAFLFIKNYEKLKLKTLFVFIFFLLLILKIFWYFFRFFFCFKNLYFLEFSKKSVKITRKKNEIVKIHKVKVDKVSPRFL